jgi:hypothetical protein
MTSRSGTVLRPIRQDYRTSPYNDKRGGFRATKRDKAPHKTHHAPVIRPDLELLDDRTPAPLDHLRTPSRQARA